MINTLYLIQRTAKTSDCEKEIQYKGRKIKEQEYRRVIPDRRVSKYVRSQLKRKVEAGKKIVK